MATRNRTPSVLGPYLALPPETSLILLTGTLGCSANWLVARFAASVLGNDGSETPSMGVVLVSWMRDEGFWRAQIRRAAGVDVARLRSGAAFEFVDRLAHGLSDGTLDRPESALVAVEDRITQAISRCSRSTQGGKVVLILDTPDALPASDPTISALELNKLLLKLRSTSEAHATVLSCLADLPLFSPEDRPPTPLEAENAAFLVQQAHLADLVLSVRELQTGAARDVSGVLRITKGGRQAHVEGNGALEEMEKLYLVQRDGTVKFVE